MRVIRCRVKFITPCLGNKEGDVLSLYRDGDGNVIFLQSWWDAALRRAAKAAGKHQTDVGSIRFSPVIDGHVRIYKRHYKRNVWRKHEAFLPGDEVAFRAMVPNEISASDFRELLSLIGEYFGISPYRATADDGTTKLDESFGRFRIVEVKDGSDNQQTSKPTGDQAGNGNPASAGAGADVPEVHPEVREGAVHVRIENDGEGRSAVPVQ